MTLNMMMNDEYSLILLLRASYDGVHCELSFVFVDIIATSASMTTWLSGGDLHLLSPRESSCPSASLRIKEEPEPLVALGLVPAVM